MMEIRRYNGRKYYCEGKYIRLTEIADLVYNGIEFYIVRHDNNEDITAQILNDVLHNERKIQNKFDEIVNIKARIISLVVKRKMQEFLKTDTGELPRGLK